MSDLSDISVRLLTHADWEILREIRLCALKECESVYLSTYQIVRQESPEYWKDIVHGDDRAIFCLFHRDQVIGLGSVFTSREDPSGQTGVMAMGYILPEYRKRGFSRFLYEARIDWAKKNPALCTLEISHRKGNEASRRAILKNGFVFVREDTVLFGDGREDQDLCYEMDVSEA